MLWIVLVVAYPYDRLLEPLRVSEKKLQSFSLPDSKSTSKQKEECFFSQWNRLSNTSHPPTHTQKNIIRTHSKIPYHLSLWHKSESQDLYNGWQRCCKLVSPCSRSSHWAYKHPLPTETRTELSDLPACWSQHCWRLPGAPSSLCVTFICGAAPQGASPKNMSSFKTQPHKTEQVRPATACLITTDASMCSVMALQ